MPDLAPEPLSWLDEHPRPGEEHSILDERSWTRWLNRDRQRLEVGQRDPKPEAESPVAGETAR